jgi:hypothetical protein
VICLERNQEAKNNVCRYQLRCLQSQCEVNNTGMRKRFGGSRFAEISVYLSGPFEEASMVRPRADGFYLFLSGHMVFFCPIKSS